MHGRNALPPRLCDGWLEPLERRLLLAVVAQVNFQPLTAQVPAGYTADGGLVYGPRGGGLTFGWNLDTSVETRDRNAINSPDQRYDTLIHLQRSTNPNALWELAVPNGTYSVRAVAGDAIAIDSVYRINIENVLAINATPVQGSPWVENTVTVFVTDGRLTVSNAPGSSNNKLCFIEVSTAEPAVTVAAIDPWAGEKRGTLDRGPVDGFKSINRGTFSLTRSFADAAPLVVGYTISGTATSGADFQPIIGSATIPAGAASAEVLVTPLDDALPERAESILLTITSGSGYTVGPSASATVRILDDETSNVEPSAPVITEPLNEGELVSGFDVHMEVGPIVDLNLGDLRLSTDWEIWTTGASPVRVWVKSGAVGESDHHIHLGDGTFEGPLAGQTKLAANTDYQLRSRTRDDSGEALTEWSDWSVRNFRTLVEEPPTAPGWVARQPGYVIEEIPFTFPSGELNWRLPVSIAFVPEALRGDHPLDPLFYVNELYGQIRVVTNNYTVRTFASGLLNYNPNGPISGTGENGMGGLTVDPVNGDLYATMLYDDLTDGTTNTFPKVTRLTSADGGLTANAIVDILKMPGESMLQSHIVSDISFGPDDKLYVHVGDGFEASAAQNLLRFKGKVLRMNRDGTAPADNPRFDPVDRNNDGLPDAEDYWYARGLRNPFGGAWRDANPGAGTAAQHFMVENGPSLDRFSMLARDRNYGYDGNNTTMQNFNIAYSATGVFENGVDDWQPAPAPVDLAFIQASDDSSFSGFPVDKHGHAFIATSGPTHASGPNSFKSIQEWVLNPDGTRRVSGAGEPNNWRELASYEGAGYSTAAGIAAGPGGLYFTTLYPDTDANPTNPGAKVLRIVYAPARAARNARDLAASVAPVVNPTLDSAPGSRSVPELSPEFVGPRAVAPWSPRPWSDTALSTSFWSDQTLDLDDLPLV